MAFVATLFAGAPPALAQAPAAQPTAVLGAIHAAGSSYNDAQVAAASGLKPGDLVTRDDIQAAANRLALLGVFSNVNYSFVPAGDKITLNFTLQDAPRVPVEFDNFPALSDDQLRDAIRQAAPLFDGSAPTDGAELDQMDAAIAKLLSKEQMPGQVEHRLLARPIGDGTIMEFSVQGAGQAVVDSLDLGDALARASEPLRDRQKDLLHKPYSRLTIEIFEDEQILPIYLATGHLRARFDAPQVSLAGTPRPGVPSNVAVVLRIDPGPALRLASVDWKGSSVLTNDALANFVPLKPGDLADGVKLAGAWQRIESEYNHRGYLDAKVIVGQQFDDAASTVSYHITVNEGAQYHMGNLVLTGLSLDAETRLRAFWTMPKGAVFDTAYFDSMLTKLAMPTPEVFQKIPLHYSELGHDLRVNATTHVVDVLLDFK